MHRFFSNYGSQKKFIYCKILLFYTIWSFIPFISIYEVGQRHRKVKMASAHGLPCTWLGNRPEFHAACCKVNRWHVPVQLLSSPRPHTQCLAPARKSCGDAARAHCPMCNDIHGIHSLLFFIWSLYLGRRWRAYCKCDWPSAGAMSLVLLAMGVTRILVDVTCTLGSYTWLVCCTTYTRSV